jgi:hypothetical protein
MNFAADFKHKCKKKLEAKIAKKGKAVTAWQILRRL